MGATSVDLRFPLNSIEPIDNVTGTTRRMREFEHEILTITVTKHRALSRSLRTGDVMIAELKGAGEKPIRWAGYVHEVRAKQTIDDASETRIVCVGPTWAMKNPRQRVWANMSISQIASQIIWENNLAADVEPHGLVIPQVVQAGESDWAFLCRIAKQYGYVVFPEGVVVHFHSRLREHEERNHGATLMKYHSRDDGLRGNIWEFKPVLSDAPDAGRAVRIAGGVDGRTGAVWASGVSGSPQQPTRKDVSSGKFSQYETSVVGNSLAEVQAKVQGLHDTNMWTHRAKAECDGRAHVTPTSVLYFDNLDGGFDGYWHVIGVTHDYSNRDYYRMYVEAGTDSLGMPWSSTVPDDSQVPLNEVALQQRRHLPAYPVLVYPALDAPTIQDNRSAAPIIYWRSDRSTVSIPVEASSPRPWFVARRHRALQS